MVACLFSSLHCITPPPPSGAVIQADRKSIVCVCFFFCKERKCSRLLARGKPKARRTIGPLLRKRKTSCSNDTYGGGKCSFAATTPHHLLTLTVSYFRRHAHAVGKRSSKTIVPGIVYTFRALRRSIEK